MTHEEAAAVLQGKIDRMGVWEFPGEDPRLISVPLRTVRTLLAGYEAEKKRADEAEADIADILQDAKSGNVSCINCTNHQKPELCKITKHATCNAKWRGPSAARKDK